MLKKTLKITGIALGVLIVILFAAPFLFKGKIIKIVKEQINKNINARVDFKDLDLSFFRHFPRVSMALEGLQVIGTGTFAKDTLISADDIDVALNPFSIISGKDMKVYSVGIDHPRIHAIVTKDGQANWDIAKEDTTTQAASSEKSSPFKLNLEHYAIRNGYIRYDDAGSNMSTEIVNLNHEGSGDFTADLFTLQTKTTADAVSFTYDGVPYLLDTKTGIDLDVQVDNKTNKYSFRTDEINLNDLRLSSDGFFQLVNDSTYNMDIRFKTPSNDFKSILSLVPAVYKNDFNKIKTSGTAAFNGFVKGTYSATQIPAYSLNLDIQNGFFQYPDLPQPVKNINLTAKVENPDGVTDHTVIDIPKAHIEFGNDPFDFHLLLKKPVTDQWIDAAVKGKLDLSGITRFVKLDAGTKLGGQVNADLQATGNLAVIEQQKPGPFTAKGFADIQNLYYASGAFPQPIQHTSARINIDNPDGVADHTVIQVPSAHIEVGKDAVDLSLLLKNPASDPYFDGSAKGAFNLANVSRFYTFEPGTSLSGTVKADMAFKGKKSMIDKSEYDAIQTTGNVEADNLNYVSKDYPDGIKIHNARLRFNPKNVTLQNMSGNFMQTNFDANGSFDNLIGYALKDETLVGNLNLSADKVDLNKWMGSDTATTATATPESSSGPFAVPKNIAFTLNTKAGDVKYDKVDYRDVKGTLLLKDETVTLKDVTMNALDGTIGLSGSYSTKDSKTKPAIDLAYDVQDLDVQKTFYAYNTFQKLMPIGQFIAGKLSSKMSMKGRLGEDMYPDLGTLTGQGSLFLIQGFLSKFGPLEKMASTLHVADLKEVTLKDIKSYFEFANGKVLVKPFTVKTQDIEMEIGGMHGLDQSIDYAVNMKIPRSKLGSAANQLVNNLVTQANSKGIPVKPGDMINLRLNIGGTITHPTVKTDMKEAAGSLTDELKDQASQLVAAKKAAADSAVAAAKVTVKDTLRSVGKQVAGDVKEQLKNQLFSNKDSAGAKNDSAQKNTKQKAEESARGLLNNLLKKKKGNR